MTEVLSYMNGETDVTFSAFSFKTEFSRAVVIFLNEETVVSWNKFTVLVHSSFDT